MSNNDVLSNRHDILILFDVTQGNPNGDPDAGNMPRLDPNTNKGIVTDVCLKRKVRNYVEMFPPDRKSDEQNGFNIIVKQGVVLNDQIKHARNVSCADLPEDAPKDVKNERTVKWLCREFYDVRAFGAVVSTENGNFIPSTTQ